MGGETRMDDYIMETGQTLLDADAPAVDEDRACDSHGVVDCARCAYEERYRAYEEEQGAIEAEEAMAV